MVKVLCIEDEPDFREDIAEYLRMHAYEVDEAADGNAALALLQQHEYDLVICDIMMPGMDGFSVLKEHRSNLGERVVASDVPFVFLTALSDVHDQITAHNLGCDDFLSKPVDFKLLGATINNRITRYAQTRIERELAQTESVSALQAVYAHELMQPAIQLYEVAQYIGGLQRDDAGMKKLDVFLPKMQELAKRQLASIEILREIENLQQEAPPTQSVNLTTLWLDETARHLCQRMEGLVLEVEYQGNTPYKIVAEPAWLLRALYHIISSMHRQRVSVPMICTVESAAGYMHIAVRMAQEKADATISPQMSVQACLLDRGWRRAVNMHWGALHYADAAMRKQGGYLQFQTSAGGLHSIALSLPLVQLH